MLSDAKTVTARSVQNQMRVVRNEDDIKISQSCTSALKIDSTLSLSLSFQFPSGFFQLDLLLLLLFPLYVAHILVLAMCLGTFNLIICGPAFVQI